MRRLWPLLILLPSALASAQAVSYNFSSSCSGLPWGITFSRASTATYTNSSDVLSVASVNTPRLDYPGGGATCYYLSEPAATNIIQGSNSFSTDWFAFGGTTVNASQFTSPDGTNDGWSLTTSGAGAGVGQYDAIKPGPYTFTVWAKTIAGVNELQITSAGGVDSPITTTGTTTRYVYTNTYSTPYFQTLAANLLSNTIGSSSDTVGIFGAQLEIGPTASSYIPSTSGPATRSADVATFTIPSGMGVSEMTYTFSDATTQTVYAPASGTYTIRTDHLNEHDIATLVSGTGTAQADAPDFLNGTNVYYNALTETLTDYLGGLVKICVTTDGSSPAGTYPTCTHGAQYTTPISVTTNGEQICAIAIGSVVSNSAIVCSTYTLETATPLFDLDAGQIRTGAPLNITTATNGASILYSLNTTPSCPSTGTPYTGPVTISTAETVNAVACLSGYSSGAALSAAYTVRAPTTFYVSYSTGSNLNVGTDPSTPWQYAPGMGTLTTIGNPPTSLCTDVCALVTLVGGDRVLLYCADTWANLTLTVENGGDSGANIYLGSYGNCSPGQLPTIQGANNFPSIAAENINNGYWTVDGLNLPCTGYVQYIGAAACIYHGYYNGGASNDGPTPGWLIEHNTSQGVFWIAGPNVTVTANNLNGYTNGGTTNNCSGLGSGGACLGAILITGVAATNSVVCGNNIQYYSGRGIGLEEGATGVVCNNIISHIASDEADMVCFCGQGVDFDGADIPGTLSSGYGNQIGFVDGNGMNIEQQTYLKLHQNLIHDTTTAAIQNIEGEGLDDGRQGTADYNDIYNNVVYNTPFAFALADATHVTWEHNTAYLGTASSPLSCITVYSFFGATSEYMGDETFENNICEGWTNQVIQPDATDIWTTLDHDLLYPAGSAVMLQNGTPLTLAQMQTNGWMLNGQTTDPQFVSPSTQNFTLLGNSPAIATGSVVASPFNLLLNPASQPPWTLQPAGGEPNIGAFGSGQNGALWFGTL